MEFEFEVLVAVELVPCQYHVMPAGGDPLVSVLSPQEFSETEGWEGTEGLELIVTLIDLVPVDQTLPQLAFALR